MFPDFKKCYYILFPLAAAAYLKYFLGSRYSHIPRFPPIYEHLNTFEKLINLLDTTIQLSPKGMS